ncbi:S9 family peptidase [Nocardia beijingensis]|uniref:S9 family peptidase n=1 Tax=Nocardia beijingensis TaxID=95162 RepID=UPI0033EAE390
MPDRYSLADWFSRTLAPLLGAVGDLADPCPAPDGRHIACTGVVQRGLGRPPEKRLYLIDPERRSLRELPGDRQVHGAATWSPDSGRLAAIQESDASDAHQLWIIEPDASREGRALPLPGWAEYVEWSPDGRRILIGVAPDGVDRAGALGSDRVGKTAPASDAAPTTTRWLALLDPVTGAWERVTSPGLNVWEAGWCGPDALVLLVSDDASEDSWYSSRVIRLALESRATELLYRPVPEFGSSPQLGWLTASLDGRWVGLIEGVCSDRGLVAGDVRILDLVTGASASFPAGFDATSLARSDHSGRFVSAGLRGPCNVVATIDATTQRIETFWEGTDFLGGARRFPKVVVGGERIFAIAENLDTPTGLVELTLGRRRRIWSVADTADDTGLRGVTSRWVSWKSSDGTEIHGLLTLPSGVPRGLLLWVHGGPVSVSADQWKGRPASMSYLLAEGIAIFRPNPRGSVGGGRESVARLVGDLGGVDTEDVLSGLDWLSSEVLGALPTAVGGESYGGYLTAWLLTETTRFKAAVVSSPITDWTSFQQTSNIRRFAEAFATGPALGRNPLRRASEITTPTLVIVGGRDRCTPPGEGRQLHDALRAGGRAPARLVEYPHIGHVPREFPALLNYSEAIRTWFTDFLWAG